MDEDEIPPPPPPSNGMEVNREKRRSVTRETDTIFKNTYPSAAVEQAAEENKFTADEASSNSKDPVATEQEQDSDSEESSVHSTLSSPNQENESMSETNAVVAEEVSSNRPTSDEDLLLQTKTTAADEKIDNSSEELHVNSNENQEATANESSNDSEIIHREAMAADERNKDLSEELEPDAIENISSNENDKPVDSFPEHVQSESISDNQTYSLVESETSPSENDCSQEYPIVTENEPKNEEGPSTETPSKINSEHFVDDAIDVNEDVLPVDTEESVITNSHLSESANDDEMNKNCSMELESTSNQFEGTVSVEESYANERIPLSIVTVADESNDVSSTKIEVPEVERVNNGDDTSVAERSAELSALNSATGDAVDEKYSKDFESGKNEQTSTSECAPAGCENDQTEKCSDLKETCEDTRDLSQANSNPIELSVNEQENQITEIEESNVEDHEPTTFVLQSTCSVGYDEMISNESEANFNDETNQIDRSLLDDGAAVGRSDLTDESCSDSKENLKPSEKILGDNANDSNQDEQDESCSSASSVKVIPPEPEDILGNKTLLKQMLVTGKSNTHPTRSTLATVSYELRLMDNVTSNEQVIEKVEAERFFLSECDIISAIDISVQTMNIGEKALIYSDPRHCYGDFGCEEKQIPPVSSRGSYKMKILLELIDWKTPEDIQTLSLNERLFWGSKKKQIGNFHYRRRDYEKSLQCYGGALRFLDTDLNPIAASHDENEKSSLNENLIQVENNIAQTNLLLGRFQACLDAVENVLKHDPRNAKALFRQGKALFELGLYDIALQPLRAFKKNQKTDTNPTVDLEKVNEMIQSCETKLAHYQKNEKEIYQRMFTRKTEAATTKVDQQSQIRNMKQHNNSSWWPYVALGGAAVATLAFLTFLKHRKAV